MRCSQKTEDTSYSSPKLIETAKYLSIFSRRQKTYVVYLQRQLHIAEKNLQRTQDISYLSTKTFLFSRKTSPKDKVEPYPSSM